MNDSRRDGTRVLHHLATTVAGTGVDTFVLQLCAAQQRLGLEPLIACDPTNREEFLETARARSLPVYRLPSSPPGLPKKAQLSLRLALRTAGLVRYLGEQHVDLVHVHAVVLNGLEAHLATAARRVPLVVTHHATLEWWRPMWTRQSDVILELEKWRTRYVVCPYQRAADELREHGISAERLVVVPFCADEERFSHRITLPKPGEPLRLITVSRLVAEKGHAVLLEALARLRPRLSFRLEILGTGPAQADIAALIDRLGLADVVTLAGHVPHAEVPARMAQAHVVVLPSFMGGETFPICLLEGMCMGMPAIGTRWFGIPDIIRDGENGLLVEPRDVDTLERALERLGSDPTLLQRMSDAALRRAHAEFTGAAVAASYRDLYREARPSA